MSAAAWRYSMRVALALPGMARSAVVRFSTPQVAVVGAQAPSTMRLYEFTVGAMTAVSSGMSSYMKRTTRAPRRRAGSAAKTRKSGRLSTCTTS